MSNFVFVLDTNKKPLNPCKPAIARKLLKTKKAAVFKRYPFTIILNKTVDSKPKPMTLKIDPGSKVTGFALLQDNKVIWGAELKHRGQQIKDALGTRRSVRRSRRDRHSPYRKPRFLNRAKPKGWLPPSLMHRVLTTMTWVKRLQKLAPITTVFQELVRFDTQAIQNPEISGIEYQQGELEGYEVREYLLEKWGRKCAYCYAQNTPLEIEHIKPRSKGGSNRVSNLTLACHRCNQTKSNHDIEDFLSGKPDLLRRIQSKAKAPLKDAAAVNSTRWALFNALKTTELEIKTGSGGLTKFNRCRLGLPKTHWLDAACVGTAETLEILTDKPLLISAKGHGNRQLCRINKHGFPISKPRKSYDIPWKTGDVARHASGTVGRVVIQSAKRLAIRLNGKRITGKLTSFNKLFSKDGYSYA